jgi:hypothetical protein
VGSSSSPPLQGAQPTMASPAAVIADDAGDILPGYLVGAGLVPTLFGARPACRAGACPGFLNSQKVGAIRPGQAPALQGGRTQAH